MGYDRVQNTTEHYNTVQHTTARTAVVIRYNLPVRVRTKRRTDNCFPTKISSGKNLRFTVHLYMKTLFTSKDRERYSTGKVDRNGYPSTSCTAAQILRQINVSLSPVAMSSTSRTPGAYSNMFIFTDTARCKRKDLCEFR